ncbi:MAG: glycosyltransferase family 2 protein [Bacteroidales bacterium]|nr:glycosyltransferase family 2 protein [Bacteroidales bacterium]
MNKLSVVIITFNEEKNIRRCLESVQKIADEIVVVDSFSTDHTAAICSEFTMTFVQQQWLGYSEQKNYANSLASNELIFSIDADEVVSEELQKSIENIKQQSQLAINQVFSMNRLTNYCGKWIRHCGWYPDTKIRIWNRNYGKWEGSIHETINFSNDSYSITHLNGDLFHYSFSKPDDYKKQMFHFAELRGKYYFEKEKKNAVFFCIASPIITFLRQFFFKLGFLEGITGLKISWIAAKATHHKYLVLKQLKAKKI